MPTGSRTSNILFRGLNGLLGAAFLADLCIPRASSVWDMLTLALAALASVAALSRQLPLQNVLPAALIAAAFGGIAEGMSANPNLSAPFGPVAFNPAAGAKLFNSVPWTVPLIWVAAIFNSRGMARLIMRPWRKVKNYGFWLIGLTAVLAVAFDVALEPYAASVKHLWRWQPTKIAFTWQGATPINFLSWAFVSLLILAFATPSLIRKQPGGASKPDFHSFALWQGSMALFAVGSACAGLWLPVGVDAVIAAVTVFFAIRGAKW